MTRSRLFHLLCGALMLIGIILVFFYPTIGGVLIGLSVGLYFAMPLQHFVLYIRKGFQEEGIFKLLMLLGILLYFLLVATAFVLSVVVGLLAMAFVRFKKRNH